MPDGTVPVNEEEHPAEGCECPVTSGTSETEGSLAEEVRRKTERLVAVFEQKYIYTVYAFGGTIPINAYQVAKTISRRLAEDKAKLYKGVITRSEIIGDFRNWEG